MDTRLRHQWAMVVLLTIALVFGPSISQAFNGNRSVFENDVHWIKTWIQKANNLDDNARTK